MKELVKDKTRAVSAALTKKKKKTYLRDSTVQKIDASRQPAFDMRNLENYGELPTTNSLEMILAVSCNL